MGAKEHSKYKRDHEKGQAGQKRTQNKNATPSAWAQEPAQPYTKKNNQQRHKTNITAKTSSHAPDTRNIPRHMPQPHAQMRYPQPMMFPQMQGPPMYRPAFGPMYTQMGAYTSHQQPFTGAPMRPPPQLAQTRNAAPPKKPAKKEEDDDEMMKLISGFKSVNKIKEFEAQEEEERKRKEEQKKKEEEERKRKEEEERKRKEEEERKRKEEEERKRAEEEERKRKEAEEEERKQKEQAAEERRKRIEEERKKIKKDKIQYTTEEMMNIKRKWRSRNRNAMPDVQLIFSKKKVEEKSELTNTDKVKQETTELLNKVSKDNLKELLGEFIKIDLRGEGAMETVIDTIFSKSVRETLYSEIYADIFNAMLSDLNQKDKKLGAEFKNSLLAKCRELFKSRGTKSQGGEDHEAQFRKKQQSIGNAKFIGELYNKRLLSFKIVSKNIINLLLPTEGVPSEADVRVLDALLRTAGEAMDQKDRSSIDEHFKKMKEFAQNDDVATRCQFVLVDLIKLRERGWREMKLDLIDPAKKESSKRMKGRDSHRDSHRRSNKRNFNSGYKKPSQSSRRHYNSSQTSNSSEGAYVPIHLRNKPKRDNRSKNMASLSSNSFGSLTQLDQMDDNESSDEGEVETPIEVGGEDDESMDKDQFIEKVKYYYDEDIQEPDEDCPPHHHFQKSYVEFDEELDGELFYPALYRYITTGLFNFSLKYENHFDKLVEYMNVLKTSKVEKYPLLTVDMWKDGFTKYIKNVMKIGLWDDHSNCLSVPTKLSLACFPTTDICREILKITHDLIRENGSEIPSGPSYGGFINAILSSGVEGSVKLLSEYNFFNFFNLKAKSKFDSFFNAVRAHADKFSSIAIIDALKANDLSRVSSILKSAGSDKREFSFALTSMFAFIETRHLLSSKDINVVKSSYTPYNDIFREFLKQGDITLVLTICMRRDNKLNYLDRMMDLFVEYSDYYANVDEIKTQLKKDATIKERIYDKYCS